MGFLYIIQSKGLTKIGITGHVQRRMNELKPDKVHQIVELSGEKELEKNLHQRFKSKRLRGSEYFSLSRAERSRACSLARRAGKRVRFPYQAKVHRVSPVVVMEICGLSLAIGVAAVLIAQRQPQVQPPQAPHSFAVPTKSFVSV